MRTDAEVKRVIQLWEEGKNKSQIARITKIPRTTLAGWINSYEKNGKKIKESAYSERYLSPSLWTGEQRKEYAYLLGAYLGDGYINKEPRTYKLRIFAHGEQVRTHRDILYSMRTLFPKNKSYIYKSKSSSMVDLTVHNSFLPVYFPQHGKGRKHERKIELVDFQKDIVDAYPKQMVKGLIDSDGSRHLTHGKYLRYSFRNTSKDIMNLFIEYCGRANIELGELTCGGTQIFIRAKSTKFVNSFIKAKDDLS